MRFVAVLASSAVIGCALFSVTHLGALEHVTPNGLEDVRYLAYWVLTGFGEEALFCGICLPCLLRAQPPRKAVAICALLFALAHVNLTFSLLANAARMIQAWLFGVLMCVIGLRTGKLWIPCAAHAAYDAVFFAGAFARCALLPAYPIAGPDLALVSLISAIPLLFILPFLRTAE